jgi:uncharacterized protein (DUF2062 family)
MIISMTSSDSLDSAPLLPHSTVSPSPASLSQWLRAKLLTPLISLLKSGATVEGLAKSFAFGFVGGIFPIPATTTLACLLLVWIFRLNFAAVQLINLLMTPLNLASFIWFIRCGEWIFSASPVELSLNSLQNNPILDSIRTFWVSLCYGIIAWLIFLPVATPILYLILKPAVRIAMKRIKFP